MTPTSVGALAAAPPARQEVDVTYEINPGALPREDQGGYVSLLFTGASGAQALALRDSQAVVIGRAEPADLVIADRSLSRVHARLSLRDGKPLLEDLDSTNGCMLNGARVRSALIGPDDIAELGAVHLRVCAIVTRTPINHQPEPEGEGPELPPIPEQDGLALVVASPRMLQLYDTVARAAGTTLPVLVQGPTGSGKELVARRLHEQSARKAAPFKALNCATIPPNLVESVLFGHERGAFTGAERQAKGIFEQAQSGTVFLDEVAELSPSAQAALLRVLDQRTVVRVGGTREIEVDVRVVAATHRDLMTMVQNGTFREDLMFRLDALTLSVPPLRERREEIAPLSHLFLGRARAQWQRSAQRLSEDALKVLLNYDWPGNVRQLKNVIERAVVLCAGTVIEAEHLPSRVSSHAGSAAPVVGGGRSALPELVREYEIGVIREALARAKGNQTLAAQLLGLPRRTLASKVQAYGLS